MLAGDDPVAVDMVSRELMGISAPTRYLKWAIEEGLGIGDPSRIRVAGDSVAACVRRRFIGAAEELQECLPGLVVHDRNACSGCRACQHRPAPLCAPEAAQVTACCLWPRWGRAPGGGAVIVVGDCAKDCGHLGNMVAGCPASVPTMIEALQASGAICQRCLELGHQALAGCSHSDLPYLR